MEGVFERENRDLSEFLEHYGSDADDQDAAHAERAPHKQRRLQMDARRGQSIDVVEDIRRRELPREDGYLDSFEEKRDADKRPFNREYLKEQLDRMVALEQNPYYQFVQLLAGACDRAVLDMMDHQDLERVLRERQLRAQTARRELERSVVSLRDKQAALTNARNRRYVLNTNMRHLQEANTLQQLAQRGEWLVEQALLPVLTALSELEHADSEDVIEPEERDATAPGVKAALLAIVADPDTGMTRQSLLALGRQRRLLFDLVLEHKAVDVINRLRLAVQGGTATRNPDQTKREPEEEEKTTTATSTTTGGAITVPLYKPTTTELTDRQTMTKIFDNQSRLAMLRQGCSDAYGSWRSAASQLTYTDWAIAYVSTNESYYELEKEYKIFESGPPDGQPPEVAALIASQTGGRRDKAAESDVRATLISHFLWLYMHNRSLLGLALDAYQQEDQHNQYLANTLNATRLALQEALDAAAPVVSQYFAQVLNFLALGQPLRIDDDDQRLLVRLPSLVATIRQSASLTEQNEAMRRSPEERKWIEDAAFELYYATGKTEYREKGEPGKLPESEVLVQPREPKVAEKTLDKPAEWPVHNVPRLVLEAYPVLTLYSLIRGYAMYAGVYSRHLARRLARLSETVDTLERQIEEISRESNSLDGEQRRSSYVQTRGFVMLPVNSGIIKLAPFVVTALDKAYRVVRQQCPALRGLSDANGDFYCREAHRAGLAGDFARFVGALIAELRLVHVSQYNTQHQANSTLMATDDALRALRRYRVARSFVSADGFVLQTPEDSGSGALSRLATLGGGGGTMNTIVW